MVGSGIAGGGRFRGTVRLELVAKPPCPVFGGSAGFRARELCGSRAWLLGLFSLAQGPTYAFLGEFVGVGSRRSSRPSHFGKSGHLRNIALHFPSRIPRQATLPLPVILCIRRHTLPDGRHGHAVRGGACCRQHFDAGTRLKAHHFTVCVNTEGSVCGDGTNRLSHGPAGGRRLRWPGPESAAADGVLGRVGKRLESLGGLPRYSPALVSRRQSGNRPAPRVGTEVTTANRAELRFGRTFINWVILRLQYEAG